MLPWKAAAPTSDVWSAAKKPSAGVASNHTSSEGSGWLHTKLKVMHGVAEGFGKGKTTVSKLL